MRGKVLYNLQVNWQELVAYFEGATLVATSETKFKIREISTLLKDDQNRLYFIYLTPIVQEFEKINSTFQSSGGSFELEAAMADLTLHHKVLKDRVYKADGELKSRADIDFGYQFVPECYKVEKKMGCAAINNIKDVCQEFLVQCIQEPEKRFPSNKKVFENMDLLSPKRVLSEGKAPFSNLRFKSLMKEKVSEIEEQ